MLLSVVDDCPQVLRTDIGCRIKSLQQVVQHALGQQVGSVALCLTGLIAVQQASCQSVQIGDIQREETFRGGSKQARIIVSHLCIRTSVVGRRAQLHHLVAGGGRRIDDFHRNVVRLLCLTKVHVHTSLECLHRPIVHTIRPGCCKIVPDFCHIMVIHILKTLFPGRINRT